MQIPKLVTVAPHPFLGTYANSKIGHRGPAPSLGAYAIFSHRGRTPSLWRLCKFQNPSAFHPILIGTSANRPSRPEVRRGCSVLVLLAGSTGSSAFHPFFIGTSANRPSRAEVRLGCSVLVLLAGSPGSSAFHPILIGTSANRPSRPEVRLGCSLLVLLAGSPGSPAFHPILIGTSANRPSRPEVPRLGLRALCFLHCPSLQVALGASSRTLGFCSHSQPLTPLAL